jgi:hypothetical protein
MLIKWNSPIAVVKRLTVKAIVHFKSQFCTSLSEGETTSYIFKHGIHSVTNSFLRKILTGSSFLCLCLPIFRRLHGFMSWDVHNAHAQTVALVSFTKN